MYMPNILACVSKPERTLRLRGMIQGDYIQGQTFSIMKYGSMVPKQAILTYEGTYIC